MDAGGGSCASSGTAITSTGAIWENAEKEEVCKGAVRTGRADCVLRSIKDAVFKALIVQVG